MSVLAQVRFRLVVPAIRAARIARFKHAPVGSRLELMRLPRLLRLPNARSVVLDVGYVRFESEVDVRAFDEVFFDGTYDTDYHGALVLDIGAHKGYYAAFVLLAGATHVESFEPAPANAAVLRETAAAFGGCCAVHEAAVGGGDGEAILNLSDESWKHSLLPIEGRHSVRVKVVSFARILGRLTKDSRVIVKIDAEGAECEIILLTPTDAWAPVDEIFVEHHHFSRCTLELLTRRLEEAGFQPFGRQRGGVVHFRRERLDVISDRRGTPAEVVMPTTAPSRTDVRRSDSHRAFTNQLKRADASRTLSAGGDGSLAQPYPLPGVCAGGQRGYGVAR